MSESRCGDVGGSGKFVHGAEGEGVWKCVNDASSALNK